MRSVIFLAATITIILLSAGMTSCRKGNYDTQSANTDVINYQSFAVNAESVGQSSEVTGTIFVKGDLKRTGDRHIEIAATLELDKSDTMGCQFTVSHETGWVISGIISDFPQGHPEDNITEWTAYTGEEVNIGGPSNGPIDGLGPYKRTVVMELSPDPSVKDLPQFFEIGISIGSTGYYSNGRVYDGYAAYETFSVPINVDYRTVTTTR